MSRSARAVTAVLLLGTLAVLAKALIRPPKPPLRVAFQVCNALEENRARFGPLSAYLEKALGRKVLVTHVNTFDAADMAKKREFDVLQANGYIYVVVKGTVGGTLIAREVKRDTGKDTAGLIVVRADSPVRTLADLKGRSMIFGPVLSPGGYLAQYYTMMRAGLDPEKALGRYSFLPGAWQHEKVVYAVLYGAADAGAVRAGDLERMEGEGKVRRDDFRVISASDNVPNCTFFALPHVDAGTVNDLRKALLGLASGETVEVAGERLNVLGSAGIAGYVPTEDGEFDVLRRMAKSVNLPPYGKY